MSFGEDGSGLSVSSRSRGMCTSGLCVSLGAGWGVFALGHFSLGWRIINEFVFVLVVGADTVPAGAFVLLPSIHLYRICQTRLCSFSFCLR